jgi:protein-S-isoprenylcysteine O-methyltransferase Ste14
MKTFLKVCTATAVYALVHSAFASRRAKQMSAAALGHRYRNAVYRPFYLVQSIATIAVLMVYIRRLPGRTLYRFHGAPAAPFRLIQAGGIVWATYAAYEVGLSEILGLRGLLQLLRGEAEIAPEPEAQGPAPTPEGTLRVTGPFVLSRHPLNVAPLVILWSNPRMTTNLLAFNVVSTLYLVIGSWHEEVRLRSAYGDEYQNYTQSGVPFYVPRVRTS